MGIISGFAAVVLVAMTINGIVGFASNVIALPILSNFMDLSTAVTILAIISTVQCMSLAILNHRWIIWKIVGVLALVNVIGSPIGSYLVQILPEHLTKIILGLFVLFVAVRQILAELQTGTGAQQEAKPVHPANLIYVFLSGLVNGAFACGGPLMVIYLSKLRLPMEEYRAINFAFGTISMGLPAVQHVIAHQYVGNIVPFVIVGLAMVALSVVLSSRLIQRINRKQFQLLVDGALVLSGLLMVVQNI